MNNALRMFLIAILVTSPLKAEKSVITIGSKKFTESVVLGEIVTQLVESDGLKTIHKAELGGTRILFNALMNDEIDIYPEYTGTIKQEILKEKRLKNDGAIPAILAEMGIGITASIGFNNTYALGVKSSTAEKYNLQTISSLRNFTDLKFGFSNEFIDRGDGWNSLKEFYNLEPKSVTGMDHDLAYRALDSGQIDLIDVYATDAEISYYNLKILTDDKKFFPVYNAVYLYRLSLKKSHPQIVASLGSIAGRISENRISNLNAMVKMDKIPESEVAAEFLKSEFGIERTVESNSVLSNVIERTVEHLFLTVTALMMGILVALPLGVVAYKTPRLEKLILGLVGIIQTIPALALLVLMIPLLGISEPPAIAALFLYSLLPIVRNTHSGLTDISKPIIDSARALGLGWFYRLIRVELPLASSTIIAGIKTSAVITIGFATLGALIGAGGYGQPILTGIRLDDFGLIMQGAVPAGIMALLAQGLFDLLEKLVVPRGLRIGTND